MSKNKVAVLSMDVEDWYHLYYFLGKADNSYSMIDGFENYMELMNKHNIKTTFFVLSELADDIKQQLRYAVSCGHEIACHGKRHIRPIDMSCDEFRMEITDAKHKLEDIIGKEIKGYRAPCYGIDNERYKIIKDVGFIYSSSKMNVKGHPLYGDLNLDEFNKVNDGIYTKNGMTEFALSTQKFIGKDIAVSGGGWIRLLPWQMFIKPLLNKYIMNSNTYFLYIHPFELSKREMPTVNNTGLLANLRARMGRNNVEKKIECIINMLQSNNYSFTTFENCYLNNITTNSDIGAHCNYE